MEIAAAGCHSAVIWSNWTGIFSVARQRLRSISLRRGLAAPQDAVAWLTAVCIWVETVVQVVRVALPKPLNPTTMTSTIKPQINAYSIAEVPASLQSRRFRLSAMIMAMPRIRPRTDLSHPDVNEWLPGSLFMEDNPTFVPVVAVALIRQDRRILMQKRRFQRVHGGLWEFPGGKLEPGESPESALIREIVEELGVKLDPAALVPVSFASDPALPPAPRQPHVILLYSCRRWHGEPMCLDAEELGWFTLAALAGLDMPPLDVPLAAALAAAWKNAI